LLRAKRRADEVRESSSALRRGEIRGRFRTAPSLIKHAGTHLRDFFPALPRSDAPARGTAQASVPLFYRRTSKALGVPVEANVDGKACPTCLSGFWIGIYMANYMCAIKLPRRDGRT
jgi:hypothetical protein